MDERDFNEIVSTAIKGGLGRVLKQSLTKRLFVGFYNGQRVEVEYTIYPQYMGIDELRLYRGTIPTPYKFSNLCIAKDSFIGECFLR